MFENIELPNGMTITDVKKKINKYIRSSEKEIRPEKCILCGKPIEGTCNSHSVPQMALRNIAVNGELLQASAVMNIEVMDAKKGVKNSGTFHYICNSCDNSFFQDYEDEKKLLGDVNDKLLAEIATKNHILQLSKHLKSKELLELFQQETNAFGNIDVHSTIKELDTSELQEEIDLCKKIVEKNLTGGYRILYKEILPYRVPITMQNAIVLDRDLEGNEVNDVFDLSEETRMQFLHLAVFPLEKETLVLLFHHKKDKLYRKLMHQINCMKREDVLKYINYLIFAYTENYFISPSIQKDVTENIKLRELALESNQNPALGLLSADNNFGIGYTPVSMDEIPNFLSSEYAIVV